MSLDPPLPVYLFNVVAGLKDKSAKGYPVKKVSVSGRSYARMIQNLCLSAFPAAAGTLEVDTYLLWGYSRACTCKEAF